MTCKRILSVALATAMLAPTAFADWETVWQAGAPGRGWPQDQGGIIFVQEAGVNPPPGDPNSPAVNQQADDDFYFEGTYPDPIGTVPTEIAVERAFAGTDNDLRFHFNIDSVNPNDSLRFSFEANNLDQRTENSDPRYGVEISVNGVIVHPEQIIGPGDLNMVFTTEEFNASEVGLVAGPGADNVLALRGVGYGEDGGGNWMGMDYHHLEINPVPEPSNVSMMLVGMFWIIPVMTYRRRMLA